MICVYQRWLDFRLRDVNLNKLREIRGKREEEGEIDEEKCTCSHFLFYLI